MALPASGAISFRDINVELGLSPTATISLNDAAVRTLFGIASGAIAMGAGYGKSNQFAFNLTAGANVDLRTQAIAAGWNQSSKVVATLASGTISSSSTGSYALTISGSFPGGLDFINNGTITGRGGDGGQGGNATQGFNNPQSNSGNGGAAGPALFVSTAVSITNTSGSINGGGGGGGGGNAGSYVSKSSGWYQAGGGGGGGGIGVSSGGGAGNNSSFGGTQPNPGSSGTISALGGGGSGGNNGGGTGGTGGSGGGYGSAGSSATGGAGTKRTGGAAGAAIVGNSNITWVAFGTRNGSIS